MPENEKPETIQQKRTISEQEHLKNLEEKRIIMQREFGSYKKMMHRQLLVSFQRKQLERLLQINGKFIYVHPWYNDTQLLIKISDKNLVAIDPDKTVPIRFMYIDENANAYPLEVNSRDLDFYRFDSDLMKEILEEFDFWK